MKSQYFLAVTAVVCGLFVSTNGMHIKRTGYKIVHNEMNSQLTPNLEHCDMNKFQIGEEIGFGRFGDIYEVERLMDRKLFAMKKGKNLPKDIEALSHLKGFGFVPDILCTGEDQSFFIMEKVNGVTLENAVEDFLFKIGPVKESEKMKIFQTLAIEMFSILKEIHNLYIYHNDCKTKNWMVEKDSLKLFLIDFGSSKLFDSKNEDKRNNDIALSLMSLNRWASKILLLNSNVIYSVLKSLEERRSSTGKYHPIEEIIAFFQSMNTDMIDELPS